MLALGHEGSTCKGMESNTRFDTTAEDKVDQDAFGDNMLVFDYSADASVSSYGSIDLLTRFLGP